MDYLESRSLNDAGEKKKKKGCGGERKGKERKVCVCLAFLPLFLGGGGFASRFDLI